MPNLEKNNKNFAQVFHLENYNTEQNFNQT